MVVEVWSYQAKRDIWCANFFVANNEIGYREEDKTKKIDLVGPHSSMLINEHSK